MYRTSATPTTGFIPFYMWYWGGARPAVGWAEVIVVGGDTEGGAAGWASSPASTLSGRPGDGQATWWGRQPTITHVHNPPILMADVE